MHKLVLIRHGESEWNKLNLFTGWTDVDLSARGVKEAARAGKILKEQDFDFDVVHTSLLKRAIHRMNSVLFELDREWLPIYKSWRLNERHYGALQGLNKAETAAKYGEDQVKIWRRSYNCPPPALEADDPRNPALQAQFRNIDPKNLPLTESLELTVARAVPYFEEKIKPAMEEGKRVLIVAHGNSIRALVKYFDNLAESEIVGVNIPTGVPLVYEFDDKMKAIKNYYLMDEEELKKQMEAVANQGKAK
ncbi:MAG: 2,3-diphosphoglycerate-dependent phosphoglycerate mutase [Erysipelotrichia bacterium]|nr:2,3-diphosphoglycerate-dependent phosphoglycerate mutase [Erysipelotrichia bacterium]